MPSANPDDMLLLIRCPSCGQRFKVGEDLRGRTVECGGCEQRFRINDEVIVRGKKFYPGERKDPSLNRFHRVPLAIPATSAVIPTVQYSDPPDAAIFEPVSPLRIIAGLVGVTGMIFMALFLMFGASRGGALDGMTTGNRLVMAGFTGLIGVTFLVYANPRARTKALVIGLLLTVGLISLPLVFTEGSVAAGPGAAPVTSEVGPLSQNAAMGEDSEETAELRSIIGTGPLEKEIDRLATEGSTRKAMGLWLRNLREANRLVVRDYILRTTGADPQSHFYPRGGGDFLMVVTGIDLSLEEVAVEVARLGKVERIYPEVSVVKVTVNNDSFRGGPIDKLTDRAHPAFYELNKRELDSIDLQRVSNAVKRLAEAEPKIYRTDITRKLIALLGKEWVDFKADICNALSVWSDQPGPAGEAALRQVGKLMSAKSDIPEPMIALIVKEKTAGVVPVLDQLWRENPTRWESLYGDMGPLAEATLIRRFPATEGRIRHSAVRLLGRVGGPGSVPLLEAAAADADSELKVLIRNALVSIRGRSAG